MWVFTHIKSGQKLYILTDKQTYLVGRSQGDLILAGDQSISREHATISVTPKTIKVEDTCSKYGVFLNKNIDTNTEIGKKKPVNLNIGDIVRFGRLENTFRLEKLTVSVCTSTLDKADVPALQSQINLIGGELLTKWNDNCTHLVMPNVTVTVKMLQSLAHGIPIVTPAFWTSYILSARENRPQLPNVTQFVPEINEPFVMKEPAMIHVNLDRQRLFDGKTFVFMVRRHMLNFESIIKLANGKCISLDQGRVRKSLLLNTNYIPVQYAPSGNTQCTQDISSIVDYIVENNRRVINESEIGLAIIHSSIARFCNPDHKLAADFAICSTDLSAFSANVLVEETPHAGNTAVAGSSAAAPHIPESIDLTDEPNNNDGCNKVIDLDISISPVEQPVVHIENEEMFPEPAAVNVKEVLPIESSSNDNNKRRLSIQEESVPQKKKKNNDEQEEQVTESQIPSTSSHNLSGFLSTQNHFNRCRSNTAVEPPISTVQRSKPPGETRKRALAMLNIDSDNDDDDNLFQFEQNPLAKKAKKSNQLQTEFRRNKSDDDDDDDDDNEDNLFNFSNLPSSRRTNANNSQPTKNSLEHYTNEDGEPSALLSESQALFKIPFHRSLNKSSFAPLELKLAPKAATSWLSRSFKSELTISDDQNQYNALPGSVQIKQEKLEEWEMTDAEKKRNWIKSLANAIEVRKVDMNVTLRRSTLDEVDRGYITASNSTLNTAKNFKTFVKKRNYIPQTAIIKTVGVPVSVSAFARL